MSASEHADDFVGPIVTQGEVSDAAAEALVIDNPGRETRVEEHAAYVRIQARGECVLRVATMEKLLGRKFSVGEFEANMPGFSGFIRTSFDQVRFIATTGA